MGVTLGPGCGKGTQCSKLEKDFGLRHLSAGELLRAAQSRGSEHAELIGEIMKAGKIAPHAITISLLKDAINENPHSLYVIDGFPRKMDQALKFEEQVRSV